MIFQKRQLHWGLNSKVLLSVIGIVVLIFSLSILFYIFSSIDRIKQWQHKQAENLAMAFSISNIEPLLMKDYPLLETSVKGIRVSHPDILWVKILNPENQTVVKSGRELQGKNIAVLRKQIVYLKKPLGWVEFGISAKTKKQEIFITAWSIVIVGLMTIVLVSMMLILVLRKYVLSPIRELHHFTKQVRAGNLNHTVCVTTDDELGELATSFNKMIDDLQKTTVSRDSLSKEITERKRAEEQIKNKADQLKVLYETGKRITSVISRDDLLPWIGEQAVKLLDADMCNYRIREGDYLVRGGGTKEGMELMKKERLKIGESLSGWIAKERRPLLIPDNYSDDPRLIPEHKKIAEKYGFRSALGVSVGIERKIIGVLTVVSKKPRKFTESDIELLTAFADQAAIAIENARLFEDLEQAKDDLEKSQRDLKKFSGKILSIREEEKKKLAANLHDEVGTMSVDLSTSLNIAEEEINSKNFKDALKYIRRTKKKLKNTIGNLKKTAIGLRPIDLDIIGLTCALREYFSSIEKQTKLRIDFIVNIDERKLNDEVSIALYRAAHEAINNIINHAKAKKVKIRLYSQNNNIKFNISDDGIGFDIKRSLQQEGKFLKIGIMGMRERVESLGGTFIIKSAPEKGTEISTTLPIK